MIIFVSKLDALTTDPILLDAFKQFGEVSSCKVEIDQSTGRSKGFAFVEMPNDAEGQEAIDALNNIFIDGRKIEVKAVRSADAPPRNRGGGGNRGGGPRNNG